MVAVTRPGTGRMRSELDEAYERLAERERASWRPAGPGETPGQLLPEGDPVVPIDVHRLAVTLPVSCCVLTETTGVDHCDHPPAPRSPWHTRLRWRAGDWWRSVRLRLGSWIAGVDLADDGGDW